MPKPNYDFNNPIFKKRTLIRYAKEHLGLWELAQRSDVIDFEIEASTSDLKIPTLYKIHYKLKSIIGINADKAPIFGYHHVMELGFPTRYPIEPCTIYMKTDAWHPNIKSEGKFKGKICGNVRGFGKTLTIDQLVLRIGHILQYKNYLAEFVPPYPEDPKVAEWVLNYAEPQSLVNRREGIAIDDTPLIRISSEVKPKISLNSETSEEPTIVKPTTEAPGGDKMDAEGSKKSKIIIKRNPSSPPPATRSKIVIGKKKPD